MQWSPVSEPSGAWYSALEVGLATPILWQAWKEMPGGLCYSLQVPSLWVRKAVALHGHHTSTIILAPHQPTEKEAEQERGEERRKLSESLFLWSTETVKILAEDSKSPPFLQQSLLVLHVNSWWSKPYWIKKIARFYVYKLYIVLLRKEDGWRAEHQVLLGFGDLRGFFHHDLLQRGFAGQDRSGGCPTGFVDCLLRNIFSADSLMCRLQCRLRIELWDRRPWTGTGPLHNGTRTCGASQMTGHSETQQELMAQKIPGYR